ncbi:MAG: DUF4037 domain-containing protein [Anaerolineaceae bacterium]|jgi:hypothetical protein
MKAQFIPGLQLSEWFYHEAVRPILDRSFPGLNHSVALIGFGSDVIGFDTQQSTDHMWGPRLVLFLAEDNFHQQQQRVDEALRNKLPSSFRGYATNFGSPDVIGVRIMQPVEHAPVNHLVEIFTIATYFRNYLGLDAAKEITLHDWLTFSEHRLLALTSGRVFYDDLGVEQLRRRLAYYPHDIWLYLLAAQWMKISQEEAFVGRSGDEGDELGSQVIAGRLVRSIMQLCFLMERSYAPYSKWFGKAFERLVIANELLPILRKVLMAPDWRTREGFLTQAYQLIVRKHNSLGITAAAPERATWFHERPYLVIHADQIAELLRAAIQDEQVRNLPAFRGSINQIVELTDVVEDIEFCRRMRRVWD